MQFTVPFVYEARIQVSEISGTSRIIVPDSIVVDIQELPGEQCPKAFVIGDEELLYHNGNLMTKRMSIFPDGSYKPITSKEAIEVIEGSIANPLYARVSLSPFSNYWGPFTRIWQAHSETDTELGVHSFSDLPAKENVEFTHWLADSRDECIAALNAKAARLFFVDGILHEKTEEPCYIVSLRHLDKECTRSTVSMFSTRINKSSLITNREAVFNASEYDNAVKYAESLRSKHLLPPDDILFCGEKIALEPRRIISVLIPEAITIPPFNLERHLDNEY